MQSLALCDLSGLPKLGLKGPQAAGWLKEQQIEAPPDLYDTRRLADGGLIAKIAGDEFLLEGGVSGDSPGPLAERLKDDTAGVSRIERQEATFLLVGSRAREVLAQTCGINFRETPIERVIYTRVAGVSCGIIPQELANVPAYRLWIDYSFAPFLWETLVDICESLEGRVIGAGCLFPELK